jgi:DNA polymerase-3 subunit alpha
MAIQQRDFVHLHTHSHYSLLQAVPNIPDLVAAAKSDGQRSLALTDAGSMYGAVEFYQEAKKNNIKPIIGVDFYVATGSRQDSDTEEDKRFYRLVLLAKNTEGYKDLMRLTSQGFLSGFYQHPRIDHDLISKHSKHLITILPAKTSEVAWHIDRGNTSKARQVLDFYREVFGDSVYHEITLHPEINGHDQLQRKVYSFAKEHNLELVAANDVYYLKPEDREVRRIAETIARGYYQLEAASEDYSFLTTEQINKKFKDMPAAIDNTIKIADACNVEIELGTFYFPDFELPENSTAQKELRKLCYGGFNRRGFETDNQEVIDRLEYELKIINDKGYDAYFLIVQDLLHYAHQNDIPTTIRGSVAGSMVTYLSGITNLDPLYYGLRFERFLNPDRPSAPDIDMDFADNRRDEVIEYTREKYGHDKVAQIGTFGTMLARGVVRDVARAMSFPYALGDQIAKLIPPPKQGFPMPIAKALKEVPELQEVYQNNPSVKQVIDMGQRLEGNARHISVHAAGVVIAPTTLNDFTPIQRDPKGGKLITQYDMHAVGEDGAGLTKFDFLGLKNLAILADTVKRIEWRHDKKIDIESIPIDDENTFQMLAEGKTHGTFQLNGSGMTAFLKDLKPTDIFDINAMVALYRPGPMEFIPEYIARKHNPELVEYPHEMLKDALQQSYGLLIYQEDVMYTAIRLAGYSWLDADKFRKAMGKKIPALMDEQEKKFKSGCVDNGIDPNLANELWERIKPFAAYAFNKSHSASYGRVAYQTSYFKANYPAEYMAAVLTADAGNTDKIAESVAECSNMNLEVLPPDINESFASFTVIDQDNEVQVIRFGLYSIKNFGEGIADQIIVERKSNGRFKSIADLIERVGGRALNRKSLEALIFSGALDNLEPAPKTDVVRWRADLFGNLSDLLLHHKQVHSQADNQGSLFASTELQLPEFCLKRDIATFTKEEILNNEKELLGVYISGHPLDKFKHKLDNRNQNITHIKTDDTFLDRQVNVVGILQDLRPIQTKKSNRAMAFGVMADLDDMIEVVFFPDTWDELKDKLEIDSVYKMEGKLTERNSDRSVLVDRISKL